MRNLLFHCVMAGGLFVVGAIANASIEVARLPLSTASICRITPFLRTQLITSMEKKVVWLEVECQSGITADTIESEFHEVALTSAFVVENDVVRFKGYNNDGEWVQQTCGKLIPSMFYENLLWVQKSNCEFKSKIIVTEEPASPRPPFATKKSYTMIIKLKD